MEALASYAEQANYDEMLQMAARIQGAGDPAQRRAAAADRAGTWCTH
jgi:hypothetical protein